MTKGHLLNWIWIWKPEFYLNSKGLECHHLLLGPNQGSVGTCHPETEPGQLVLLYRTSPKKDVAYLLRTASPAMVNEKWRPQPGTRGSWNYMAEFEVLARIDPPVSLQDLKACRDLEDFSALRRSMQGSYFRISPQESEALWQLLKGSLPSLSAKLRKPRASLELPLESVLESAIAKNLKMVSRMLECDLEIWTADDGVKGRQLPCREAGGRMDLLCIDRKTNEFVLLELKVVAANVATYGQICSYLGWIRKNLAGERPVRGLVLADGQDVAFRSALDAGGAVEFHEVRPIARKLKLIS